MYDYFENNTLPKKSFLIAIVAIFLIVIILYMVMSVMAPSRKMAELKKQFMTAGTDKKQPDNRIYTDSAYLALLKDKNFYQARVAMAQTDSVYLTITLPDSLINLEISGVVVHSSRMTSISTSKMLRKGNDFVISSLLGSPMRIVKDFATIPKEPIMVKIAPKDTSEYKPDVLPDTSDFEPVSFILITDAGVDIYIYQEETGKGDRFKLFTFDLHNRLRYFGRSAASVIRFRIPEYHPRIMIRLPKAEAKAIYRAIPVNGQVSVYR